jgi:hypothetical protein
MRLSVKKTILVNIYNFKLIFILSIIFIVSSTIFPSVKNAKIQFYTGQEKKFTLNPIPSKISGKLHIKGTAKYKYVLLQVQYKGNQSAANFKPDNKNQFNYLYLISQGTGKLKMIFFGSNSTLGPYEGICQFEIENQKKISLNDPILKINKKIINYVKKTIGKKVGRGECWDIAQAALDDLHANWKRVTDFGKKIDWKKEKVLPGDIIQFRNVKIVTKTKKGTRIETIGQPDHTAIVYSVKKKGVYEIAHQNIGGKRFMLIGTLNLTGNVTGKIDFYRPIAGLIKAK